MLTKYNDFNMFTDTVNVETWGKPYNVMLYLPVDYKTKVYPVFWFWNGIGEDTGSVDLLKTWGPLGFIGASWQPNFIVIAVQGAEWLDQPHIDFVFNSLKTSYNLVGPIIATGLSSGGYGVTKLMSYYPISLTSKQVVATIPMSTSEGFGSTAVTPTIQSGIGVWAFGDVPGDIHGINTNNYYNTLVVANPKGKYVWTNTNPAGHGGWNKQYNPTWKGANGMSIYDWGLSFINQSQTTSTTTTSSTTKTPVTTTSTTTTSTSTLLPRKVVAQLYNDGTWVNLP